MAVCLFAPRICLLTHAGADEMISRINALRPKQDGCHFTYDVFKCIPLNKNFCVLIYMSPLSCRNFTLMSLASFANLIVRRAGLLWSQQDFEWRWSVPLFKCLTVLEFSFILFDLCLLITFFNFIMNYVPIVTFWIFTYHIIWILSIMFCFIWSYWIIYFLACLEVSWRVVS